MTSVAVLPAQHGTAARMRTGNGVASKADGFTYLGLMLFMTISGIALAGAGLVWHTEVKREKERQLLFVGEEFRQAITSYYDNSPQGTRQFPPALEDLLRDARYPVIKRHLRRIYEDPMTGTRDWGLLREQGRIVGVYSRSESLPLKKAGFTELQNEFAEAETYQDWKFIYAASTQPEDAVPKSISGNASSLEPGVNESITTSSAGTADSIPAQNTSDGSRPDRNRQEECLAQRMSDTAACSFYCRSADSNACRQCSLSVLSRYRACIAGSAMPALSTP
jgi:type II secretory pathway pseudopilin PulG